MKPRIVGVDVGGTFTDVVAIENGKVIPAKVPTNLKASETSVLEGAETVLVSKASAFNLASTAGLNAVITRQLPKVAFLTTEGHRDILARGRVGRPVEALTDPSWRRGFADVARPVVPRYLRLGLTERITQDGQVLIPLDEAQVRRQMQLLKRCSVQGVAVCLLNSFVNPRHERRVREILYEELGEVRCSISSDVSPVAKEFLRSSTTVIDVLMKIMYTEYTDRLESGLTRLGFEGSFNYADSRAMLIPADHAMERPHRLVVGGPAAGTVSSAHLGSFINESNLICADVGGTSCDISVVVDGRPWIHPSFEVEYDLVVNALSIDIVTLGAGGGSLVSVSGTGDIKVGPESAGADPGPACYGRGGRQPTLTDAALEIGILSPDKFLGGKMALFPELATKAFEDLASPLSFGNRVGYAWRTGLNNIAEGLGNIAVRRGIDTRDFTLIAYGAAGPMLLPSLLDLVLLKSVIVPPYPGLFSALGLLSADQVYSDQKSVYLTLSDGAAGEVANIFSELENGLLNRVESKDGGYSIIRSFDGHLVGQGWDTPLVRVPNGAITPATVREMIENFHNAYEARNGNRFPPLRVRGVTFRVEVVVTSEKVNYSRLATRASGKPSPAIELPIRHLYSSEETAGEYERSGLLSGDRLVGPAVVREEMSTTFVPLGRELVVGGHGELIIR